MNEDDEMSRLKDEVEYWKAECRQLALEVEYWKPKMPTQMELPDLDSMSRNDDHETSSEAAKKALPNREKIAGRVMMCFYRIHPDGLTDDELRDMMGSDISNDSSHRKRRSELTQIGFIEDTGLTRETRTRTKAIVWTLSQKGMEYIVTNHWNIQQDGNQHGQKE